MQRLRILAASTLVLGACASVPPPPPPTAPPVFDHLVVPATRIGPVSLGMTSKQLLEAVGSPVEGYRFADASQSKFSNGLSAVVDDKTQQVWRAQTQDPSYATAEGVRIGMRDVEIRSRLGNPESVDNIDSDASVYCYDGLAVTFFAGKVMALSVYTPGHACK